MRNFYLIKKGYLILLCILFGGLINAQERVYVTTGGNAFVNIATHDSWATATSDLQAAINAVGDAGGGEVWVGSGTYYPTESYYDLEITDPAYDAVVAARSVSFLMQNGVSIIGGFNGEDTPEDRTNYAYGEDNATRLNGDIGAEGDESDNAYHVVYGQDYTDNTAVLSDVVIVNGYANGSGRNARGGGIQTRNGGTYNNLTIVGNSANRGAGAYAYRGGVFNNCLFWYNTARDFDGNTAIGGGVYMHLGSPTLENCMFNNNRSYDAGGGIGSSSGEVVKCTFINNQCNTKGGAIYTYSDNDNGVNTDGGIYKNCLMANNTALVDGGGIFADASGSWINCTVVNNKSQSVGGGIYSEAGAVFTNVVVWGNDCTGSPTNEVHLIGGGTFTNCAIGGLADLTVGTEMLSLNLTNTEVDGPHFTLPSTVKGRGESSSERNDNLAANWQLAVGSALSDMGTADITGLGLDDYDLANNDRVIQERIDIGAYELSYFRTTILATGNGTVSEAGPIDVAPGGSVSIDFTPDANHQIYTFTVNGEDRFADLVEDTGVYTFTNNDVQNNQDIAVEFISLTAYEITVSGDVGGDVSPEGIISVFEGLDFNLEIDPSNGYGLRSVIVDGEEQLENVVDNGNGTFTYSINGVSSAHTIEVDFALVHTVTINLSEGCTASHSGAVEIMEGNTINLTLTSEIGYKLRSFVKASIETIDAVIDNDDGTYSYSISGVTENLTIDVVFELFHTVTVEATIGGVVTNLGVTELFGNENLLVEITVDAGYKFTQISSNNDDIMDDVVTNPDGTYSYLVESMTTDVTIDIVFTKFEVVTITSGAGGSVNPTGDNEVLAGGELVVVITPESNYRIGSVMMQGEDVIDDISDNGDGSFNYVISNVTAASALNIQFVHFNVVTLVAGSGGTLSHTGDHPIDDGESLEITITPDAGNVVGGLTLGGEDRVDDLDDNPDGTYSYLINGLTEDAVLEVQFTLATDVDEQAADNVKLYPVPADSEIRCNTEITNVRLYNATGTLVKALDNNNLVNSITVSNLPDGVYLISYTTKSGIQRVEKVLIKH